MPRKAEINLSDSYFLSRKNPSATVEQRELEQLGLQLLKEPVIQRAKMGAERRWRMMAGSLIPAEAWENFDQKMDEWTFHYLLLGLNGDANNPKVLGHGYGPPHEWFGQKVIGCRGPGTAENPDNNYCFIPLDGHSRFELHGKRMDPAVTDCPFHIVGNLSMGMNLATLDWRDVQFADDDTFVITIDPEPANGRANHLQSKINSRYLFIRDGRRNWDEVPNAYRIHRLDPPLGPSRSPEQLVELGAKYIIDDISENFWFHRMVCSVEINTVTEPEVTTFFGGMPIQKLARGHIKIADDEAFVLHLGPGGSEYWVLVLYDYWLMSGNFWSRPSSYNNAQAIANSDGSYTFVFSIQDPGVHNWVDTLSLHEPLFMIRWNLLPTTSAGIGGEPWVKGGLVKLKDLDRVLPADTRRLNTDEREQQLKDRLASFNLRHAV